MSRLVALIVLAECDGAVERVFFLSQLASREPAVCFMLMDEKLVEEQSKGNLGLE